MFGSIGGAEFLLIAVLALLLFGPRQLPKIARGLGRALSEFRGATQEFKSSLEREVELDGLNEVKKGIRTLGTDLKAAVKDGARPTFARSSGTASGKDERRPTPDENRAVKQPDDAAAPGDSSTDGETDAQS